MVNIETGRIVDILESRDVEPVSEWLRCYPNIKYVSRDGSISYATAISKALPEAIQISDRFHLIKNISEAAAMSLQKLFNGRVEIPITDRTSEQRQTIFDKSSIYERYCIAKTLCNEGKTYSEISAILNIATKTIKKYVETPDDKIPVNKKAIRGIEHENAVKKVENKADLAKSLKDKGYSIYKISKETGFTKTTVKNYLSKDFNPVNGQYGNSRSGLLKPFHQDIIQLLSEGFTYEKATEVIRQKGYSGSVAAIRNFINKERRLLKDMKEADCVHKTEFIEKKWLKQLIFKDITEVKGITQEQFTAVIQKYPLVHNIYDIVSDFKKIVFSKSIDDLPGWIDETKKLEIDEFNSFINGINKDMAATQNAILLKYNNGLAEGSVNKLKVIKRIMYGRNSFKMLRCKLLKLENFNSL